MKVTITEFRVLAQDSDGNDLQLGGGPVASQKLTAASNAAITLDDTRFVRIATDTAIHARLTGTGATDSDPMLPANSVEYFAVGEGVTISIILA